VTDKGDEAVRTVNAKRGKIPPASAAFAASVRAGQRRALARAITLIESTRSDHRQSAEALLRELLPETGRSVRLGISGVPGVGKSSLIERLGLHIVAAGHKLAVLPVDPSSPRTGGSILGDKTRMEELSRSADAYIRPSPAGPTLGGVARRTREAVLACEAAGFDVIIVETVGVGQSETAVADLVDMFVLLLAPGGGDELQGIKRGIIELADALVVTKADGDLAAAAERARADYAQAIHLLSPALADWTPPVLKCSAVTGEGIGDIWTAAERYRSTVEKSGALRARRAEQARAWMWSEVNETLMSRLREGRRVDKMVAATEARVVAGEMTPGEAARTVLDAFASGIKRPGGDG
jgi:LAO/AO transport system kinase